MAIILNQYPFNMLNIWFASLNLSGKHVVSYQLIGVVQAMDFNVMFQLFKLIVTRKSNLLLVGEV